MTCSVCGKEDSDGKTYTLSPEAGKMFYVKQENLFVCDDCLANPLRCFADTLLEMWDVFPMTPTQKIDHICEMFRSGIRLPKNVSLTDLRHELKRRVS